jgi:dephospho-CoA kinase
VDRVELFIGEHKADFRIIECICPEELALCRLQEDQKSGEHPAENRTAELYQTLKAEKEQIVIDHIVVDTNCDLKTCLRLCVDYLQTIPTN